ncbi:unnamed protein product [Soboliphyme baturini]|uniref:ML domain-containing protein n=1 Tax=Soboliphyme baturini TaxID=241478 RepID=A0A183IPU8_9BILA|nr:unnamed protein product [Soboliphyme baturini]
MSCDPHYRAIWPEVGSIDRVGCSALKRERTLRVPPLKVLKSVARLIKRDIVNGNKMASCPNIFLFFALWMVQMTITRQSVMLTVIDCGSEVQVMSHSFLPSHPVSDFGLTVEVKFIPSTIAESGDQCKRNKSILENSIAAVSGKGVFTSLTNRENVEFVDNDGCKSSGLKCPLQAGKVASYKKFLPIPSVNVHSVIFTSCL